MSKSQTAGVSDAIESIGSRVVIYTQTDYYEGILLARSETSVELLQSRGSFSWLRTVRVDSVLAIVHGVD